MYSESLFLPFVADFFASTSFLSPKYLAYAPVNVAKRSHFWQISGILARKRERETHSKLRDDGHEDDARRIPCLEPTPPVHIRNRGVHRCHSLFLSCSPGKRACQQCHRTLPQPQNGSIHPV